MGHSTKFEGCNKVLTAPKGQEDRTHDLHTFNNGNVTVSAWVLSPEEIEEINKTGKIFLSVFFGPSPPPVFVGSEKSVKELVADYGKVW